MRLTKNEREFLATFASILQKLRHSKGKANNGNGSGKRTRRSASDVVKLKRDIRAARRRNVPVKQIADELGITTSYIYQMGK